MPVEYVGFEDARVRDGLRMVVVSGVPSPWGEAAKGILHVKQIPWVAVRLDQGSQEMEDWTGERSGPVAMYNDDAPRSSSAEIILLCEQIAPEPALLPSNPEERALAMGLSHDIAGEMGLGWCRRLQSVHGGLSAAGGFPQGIAQYLASKYGYQSEDADGYAARVVGLLEMLSARLHAQRKLGSQFFLANALSVVDIYSAAFMALFRPLPPEQCPMPENMRVAFESLDPITEKALDPILIEHRDSIYDEHLELPLSL